MKGMDIFCASQAATAICLSNMDHEYDQQGSPFSSSSTMIRPGGGGGGSCSRAIDRHNPIIRDPRRIGKTIPNHHILTSCSSQSQPEPISPEPSLHLHHHQNHQDIKNVTILKYTPSKANKEKANNNSATATHKKHKKKIVSKSFIDITKPTYPGHDEKIKSSEASAPHEDKYESSSFAASTRKSWSGTNTINSNKAGHGVRVGAGSYYISPPSPAGSSRYLLSGDQNQTAFFNVISDFDPVLKLLPSAEVDQEPSQFYPLVRAPTLQKQESSSSSACEFKPSSSSRSPDQVVVLRVSLHCRGCERKMKKHISRMEGVSSFNIDFAAKKVTVVGNVTPLGVLASISKVKNAQLWTPPAAALSQTKSSDINKNIRNQAATIVSS